ncbi:MULTISPECIES: hypothetical protein [unclassified Nocardia]|uniref:hypothetical protein n=1 Tax=unclassified Nocardia TaxID=2637762 RepID=UPI001CE48F12|nr:MULTISPECIES: hypothetical protein [unclassified Nocardia]
MELIVGAMCLAVVAVLILGLVAIPLRSHAEYKRLEALRQWATARGWSFAESGGAEWITRMPGTRRRGIGAIMSGQVNGRWMTIAEYWYLTEQTGTDSRGRSRTRTHTTYYVATVVHLDQSHPHIEVRTRGALSLLGRAVFGEKPTATGNPVFDKDFRILAADPQYSGWLVSKPLIDAHVARAVPEWSVVGNQLLAYYPGRLRDPDVAYGRGIGLLRVAELLGRP